jgi:hypothetical protein
MIIELGSIAVETKHNLVPFTSDSTHDGLRG